MTSKQIERKTPIKLPGRPAQTESRNHWPVVMEYADEGTGPWLVDLSHCRRLDIQGRDLNGLLPAEIAVPENFGGVHADQEKMITRMNASQACLWVFDMAAEIPERTEITEITESTLGLALLGKNIFRIAEKLTSLDLQDPKLKAPFLLQGPFSHVPCQVIILANQPEEQSLVVSCSRGYGHDMLRAIVQAGEEFGLRAGGQNRFLEIFRRITPDSASR